MTERGESFEGLNKIYDEIRGYLSPKDLLVVFGSVEERGSVTRIVWNTRQQNWKEFIEAAEVAAANYLVLDASYGQGDHSGQIGCINLAWVEETVVHRYPITATWWQEDWRSALEQLTRVSDFEDDGFEDSPSARQPVDRSQYERVLETSDQMLAREFTDCIKYVLPDEVADLNGIRTALHALRDSFWAGKGVDRFERDAELELKIHHVEAMARKNLEKEHDDRRKEELLREREILPDLTKECALWAKKRGTRKLTKSQVNYFLRVSDWRLSALSEEALYHEVNFILAND